MTFRRLPDGVNETTLSEIYANLECPVCRNYMSPPIPECVNKHSICRFCYKRVQNCPVCRSQKNDEATNSVLGQIYNILTIPCKFKERGCQYSCKGELLSKHHYQCCYKSRPCPVRKSQECPWDGPLSEVAEHMKTKHPSNFCEDKKKETFLLTGFRENRRYQYFTIIFFVYDNFFRLTWNIDRSGWLNFFFII